MMQTRNIYYFMELIPQIYSCSFDWASHPLYLLQITQYLLIFAQINGPSREDNHGINMHRFRHRRMCRRHLLDPGSSRGFSHIADDINPRTDAQLLPGHRLQDSVDIDCDRWGVVPWLFESRVVVL